ncbi:MAG: hypothetical protein ACJ8BW_14095 [Ktedonobacteraceae bacterium]
MTVTAYTSAALFADKDEIVQTIYNRLLVVSLIVHPTPPKPGAT